MMLRELYWKGFSIAHHNRASLFLTFVLSSSTAAKNQLGKKFCCLQISRVIGVAETTALSHVYWGWWWFIAEFVALKEWHLWWWSLGNCSYLVAAMVFQCMWSLAIGLLDAYALLTGRRLQNSLLVSLFVVGDWVST
jgi:hypothetical protein